MSKYLDNIIAKEVLHFSQSGNDAFAKLQLGEVVDEDSLEAKDQNQIGLCYYYGKDIEKDYEKAFHWYSLSANKGFPAAERNLGICYKEGTGVIKDDELSFYWYEKAAKHGNAEAQSQIAESYFEGKGVEQDEEKGWYWMEKAMKGAFESNDKTLLNYLGDCHHYGNGLFEVNFSVAAMFYRKASELGLALAKLNLAVMMLNKETDGTDQEIQELLSVAAEEDLSIAKKMIDDLQCKIERNNENDSADTLSGTSGDSPDIKIIEN